MFVNAYARALEVIPRQLCDNAGFDATDVLSRLRNKHAQSEDRGKQFGIDISTGVRKLQHLASEAVSLSIAWHVAFAAKQLSISWCRCIAGGMIDTFESYVWEPSLVKANAITAATEATCLVLSVDETITNPRSEVR